MLKSKQLPTAGLTLLLVLALLLSGCQFLQPAPESAAMHEVTDSKGVVVNVPLKPQRIVSLSIATDEILLALAPVERIAALTYLADDGGISNIAEAAKPVKTKIRAGAESVIALNPDLVLVPDWQPAELIQTLRDSGLSVYVFQSARTIQQVKENIHDLAAVIGEAAKGVELINQMEAALAAVEATVRTVPADQRKIVVYFSLMGGSGGIGSTFDDICRYAGVSNAAALAGLDMNATLSQEKLLQINPDIFLMPTWDYSGKTDLDQFQRQVQSDPALQTVKAVQTRQLIRVPERYLLCTSQYIVNGVREVARAAYPQLFPD
jgi:iron complex transport system substrate-binding protein